MDVLFIFDWSSIELAKKRSRSARRSASSNPQNIASQIFEFPDRCQVVVNAGFRQCALVTGKQSFCLRFRVRRNNQALRVRVSNSRFKVADFALKNLLYLLAKHLVLRAHLAPYA